MLAHVVLVPAPGLFLHHLLDLDLDLKVDSAERVDHQPPGPFA
ncbi:hypothetical protein ACFQ6B_25555 [Streptomyces wedmorensis]|uniref:Uncharacterized protein n=1 Tax=Streptomyces wedmorensis TaxID=43759 RepID=A0ABW6J5T3_STRWE